MLTKLRFPSGRIYSLEEIESGVPQKNGEALPAPMNYIREMFNVREWDGLPHVTDLLKGTREAYLEYTRPYAQDVDQLAYSIMGKNTHAGLEGDGSELEFRSETVQGRTDILEPIGGDRLRLTDIKNQGSYAVASALGIVQDREYVLDENGNRQIYKSGKKKGEYKTRNITVRDPSRADWGTIDAQLNIYRVVLNALFHTDALPKHLKPYQGYTITELAVFFIVRDGGTIAALSRGVDRRTYYLSVPIHDDQLTWDFIWERSGKLRYAIQSDAMPEPCTAEEAWAGTKCKKYCPVAKWCVMNGDNPFINEEDIE